MRTVSTQSIKEAVVGLCEKANCELTPDMEKALLKAREQEKSELGKNVLDRLVENADIAKNERMALCQDTGMVVVFLEIGQSVNLTGPYVEDAVNEGVRQAYKAYYFRQSVVADPFKRVNTGDNTPAVIHTRIVPGDKVKIVLAPKGFGSENMSKLTMLKPSAGLTGVQQFVIDSIFQAGGNPCPPIVVGVGVGGTMEKAALLAKEAVLRPVTFKHPKDHIRNIEAELLKEINKLGIGPQGFGGTTTAVAVHLEVFPTHIAGLPVAVNINCHVARHREIIL